MCTTHAGDPKWPSLTQFDHENDHENSQVLMETTVISQAMFGRVYVGWGDGKWKIQLQQSYCDLFCGKTDSPVQKSRSNKHQDKLIS